MKCPKCGENMVVGELSIVGKSYKAFWLPKSYYENHTFGFWPTKKAIERNGGLLIYGHNSLGATSRSYGCTKCKIVITECE